MLGYSVQYAMLEITNWIKLGLIANSNYVGTHSYILPTLDLPAYAIHGGAQGSIYFNSDLPKKKNIKKNDITPMM